MRQSKFAGSSSSFPFWTAHRPSLFCRTSTCWFKVLGSNAQRKFTQTRQCSSTTAHTSRSPACADGHGPSAASDEAFVVDSTHVP